MSRDYPHIAHLRETGPKPTVLLQIATGLTSAGNAYIRLTTRETDIVWPTGGSTWSARPFEMSEFGVETDNFPSVRVRLADVDDYWGTWLLSTDFKWERVNRYLIDRDDVTATTHAQHDAWRITSVDRGDREVMFTMEPLQALLSRMTPGRTLTREDFPGLPTEGMIS